MSYIRHTDKVLIMIWCVGFRHESFGPYVRAITVELDSNIEAHYTAKEAERKAYQLASTVHALNWPADVEISHVIPVYLDHMRGWNGL